jgi:tetratricopeptide (TPR) repeat protein
MRFYWVVLIGGAFVTIDQPRAATAATEPSKTPSISKTSSTNAPSADSIEKEIQEIMDEDDTAHAEVDKWIRENQAFAEKGAGVSDAELTRRILTRVEPIKTRYEDFIRRYPNNAKARVAYGSFLNDLHDEEGAVTQWEKGRELNPNDPAVWNNLANFYGHDGEVKKAFAFYTKAIELNTNEPIYYHNFGTTVFLFRKDAKEYYGITEQDVFNKALELYAKSLKLDPTNFPLASDVAQTYYGIKPFRADEALRAWTNTLAIAHDEIEREGVYIHLARCKLIVERFDEARRHVNAVTNEMYASLKSRLTKNLNEQEKAAKEKKAAGATDVPNSKLQTPAAETPNPKPQAPEKSQGPSSKR